MYSIDCKIQNMRNTEQYHAKEMYGENDEREKGKKGKQYK